MDWAFSVNGLGLNLSKKKYRLDFGKISEKQWKDWNDKVKYESFEKKWINGLGFFSKWTGLQFVKIGRKKNYRSDFGKISEKQQAVKW
jgi:hypothetical protein